MRRSIHFLIMTLLLFSFVAVASCSSRSYSMEENLVKAAKEIKESTVALVVQNPDKAMGVQIVGTGFLVSEDLVATVYHVARIEGLYAAAGGEAIGTEVVVGPLTMTKLGETEPQVVWDLALLRLVKPIEGKKPVTLSTRESFDVGEGVAAYGFYEEGSYIKIGKTESIAALLTQGVIAAAFQLTNSGEVSGIKFTLDLTAGQGSSGSPLFLPGTAEVIGIVSAGKVKRVLTPGKNQGKPAIDVISLDITQAESILPLVKWMKVNQLR